MVGPPSDPGDLKCQVRIEFDVELAPPCGDGDILIALGSVCISLSTESVENVILNANDGDPNEVHMIGPFMLEGLPGDCLDLENSMTAGMAIVGQLDFFDTTIGDIKAQTFFNCQ